MHFDLKLLGDYTVTGQDGRRIRLATRKSWALLAALVQNAGRPQPREVLATLLWPGRGDAQARASLRQELSVLRKSLYIEGVELIEVQGEGIRFATDEVTVDSLQIEHLAESDDVEEMVRIADLYQGDFLAGLNIKSDAFDEWLWLQREHLRDCALQGLQKCLRATTDPAAQQQVARALIRIDYTHETAHRALMKLYWRQGRRSEALSQFRKCEEALRRELDAQPSFETMNLLSDIRKMTPPEAVLGFAEAPVAARSKSGGKLAAPERRELTIAVFGITGLTGSPAEEDPEELLRIQQEFERLCVHHVSAYGGTVIDRFGEKLIAIFGYPTAHELDPERAVIAAQQIVEAGLPNGLGASYPVRAALAKGDMLLAPAPHRDGQLHVSGSAAIAATKLEQEAAPGEVRISRAMGRAIRGQFHVAAARDAGSMPDSLIVLSEKLQPDRFFMSGISDKLSTLTGRDEDLRRLSDLWSQTRLGRGQIVAILGEPGIGKSRLVYAFQKQILPQDPMVIQLGASAHHQQSALFPVEQYLRLYLGLDKLSDPFARIGALRTWLRSLSVDSEEVERPLRLLLGLDPSETSVRSEGDPPYDALIRLFTALARVKPLLLIIEDLHWIDPTSRRLIEMLASHVSSGQIMMVMTSRHELAALPVRPNGLIAMQLDRLNPSLAQLMARKICPSHWSRTQIRQLVERSDGIPLYLEELVNTVSASDAQEDPVIPESLQASLMARIDRLDHARDVLQIASVFGRVFDHETLAAVADRQPGDLERDLQELQERDLVYRIGRAPYARYEFKHALVQEQTYRSILKKQRMAHHARIADTLAARADDQEPELIARHYERADRPEDSIAFLERAGRQAIRVSANAEAVMHFSKACNIAQHIDDPTRATELELQNRLLLGPQLLAAHGFAAPEVERNYARARSLADQTQDRGELSHVLWGLWSHYVVRAHIAVAEDIGARFLKLATRLDDPVGRVAGHYMMGVTRFYSGQLSEAATAFRLAQAAYSSDHHEEGIERFGLNLYATSQSYLGWTLALSGQTDAAIEASAEALKEADALRHDFSVAFAHVFTAVMYHFLRAPDLAERHASVAASLSKGQGYAQWLAQTDMLLGYAEDLRGDARGLARLQGGLEAYMGTGASLARPYVISWLADAHARRGATRHALELVEQGLACAHTHGMAYFTPELLRQKAKYLCDMDGLDVDGLQTLLSEAQESARQSGSDLLLLRIRSCQAMLLFRMGQPVAARRGLEQALAETRCAAGNEDLRKAQSLLLNFATH